MNSAATSVREWSNWLSRVTRRKFARRKPMQPRRQMPGDAKWRTPGFSASRSNGIRRGTGLSSATAPATSRTRSSNVTGSFLRRQELETEMLQQNSIAKQLAAELTEERDRIDRIGHSDVSLPADHVVWSVSASPGSTVTEGQAILDLADCAHRFVVVDLPEREFEQIKANDAGLGAPDRERRMAARESPAGNGLGRPHG